jgi:hypothetical protein
LLNLNQKNIGLEEDLLTQCAKKAKEVEEEAKANGKTLNRIRDEKDNGNGNSISNLSSLKPEKQSFNSDLV